MGGDGDDKHDGANGDEVGQAISCRYTYPTPFVDDLSNFEYLISRRFIMYGISSVRGGLGYHYAISRVPIRESNL